MMKSIPGTILKAINSSLDNRIRSRGTAIKFIPLNDHIVKPTCSDLSLYL